MKKLYGMIWLDLDDVEVIEFYTVRKKKKQRMRARLYMKGLRRYEYEEEDGLLHLGQTEAEALYDALTKDKSSRVKRG